MKTWVSCYPIAFAALLAVAPARAYESPSLYNTPVYFEENDTYYELVLFATDRSNTTNHRVLGWEAANRLALGRFHKQRRGRLAIIRDQAVHDFLRTTFKPDHEAWIGLRYWCQYKKAMWVDGTQWKRGDFSSWGPVWNIAL